MHGKIPAILPYKSESKVISVAAQDSLLLAEIESTNFYPWRGGQPCDLGAIKSPVLRRCFGCIQRWRKDNSQNKAP
jgi:alanyl-tRNA synthetase